MLKELSKYENLGTPSFYFKLLRTLCEDSKYVWTIDNVAELFHNRIIDNRIIYDGCIPLLKKIGIIEITYLKEIILDVKFLKYLESESMMNDKFVERLVTAVSSDTIFHDIFCSKYISYDIIYRSIQIENSAFPFRYSTFKQLLIDFSILKEHPTKEFNKYIINSRYKKIFDKEVLPQIKRRKAGIDDLQKSIEQNQIYGEEAEKFILKFEEIRLNGQKEINWVAEYSTTDGYDIASYETVSSIEHDRFIEVKSFSGEPYFFWSRNEMDIARVKKLSYYLYLVDRSRMNLPDYTPIIIQDPYNNILKNNDQWEQRIEKIRLQKIITS